MSPRSLAILLATTVAAASACGPRADGGAHSTASGDCATCHAEAYETWSTSPHGLAEQSPVFEAMLPRVEAAWGEVARDRCVSCHAPGHASDGGVGCVTCHAAVGNEAEEDARLVVNLDAPLGGPIADALPTEAHGSRESPFLSSASLCNTCHTVTGPGVFVEPTSEEYAASFAPSEGLTCVDCHMPELDDGPWVEGGPDRPRRSHAFVGFDPPWGADAATRADAAQRTRTLLATAIDLEVVPLPATGFTVRVTNDGAGHAVPTGVALLRELWVELTLHDADGETLATWGHLDADTLPTGAPSPLDFGDLALDATGAPVDDPTAAVELDRRALAPGETREAEIGAPPGARLVARLRGRTARARTMIALGLEDRLDELPIHDVKSAEATSPQ